MDDKTRLALIRKMIASGIEYGSDRSAVLDMVDTVLNFEAEDA